MSTTSTRTRHRSTAVKTVAGIAATAVAGLAITAGGVYALLRAEATNSSQTLDAGTLKLTLGANANSVVLDTGIAAMAPGDVVNRFVTLTNGGSLAGKELKLQVTDPGNSSPNALTTSATKGLEISVQSCSNPWVVASNAGTCPSGSTTGAAATYTAATLTSAQSLGGGPFAPLTTRYYRVSIKLLDGGLETIVNGASPTTGSVQGLSATLRYTFSIDQRDATTTNS